MKQYLVLILSFLFLNLKLFRNCNRIFHYEKLTFLLVTVCFYQSAFSENFPGKFSVNLKLSAPLLKSDVPQICLDPGIEAMYHFSFFKGVGLGTGIGFEFGQHIWSKEYAYVIVVDGQLRKYQGIDVNHFKFFSLEIPFFLEIPIETPFISEYGIGINLGWHPYTKFSEENNITAKQTEFNRYYIDVNAGLKIQLVNFKKVSLRLQPLLSYRFYTTNNNNWQKNLYIIRLFLNTTF